MTRATRRDKRTSTSSARMPSRAVARPSRPSRAIDRSRCRRGASPRRRRSRCGGGQRGRGRRLADLVPGAARRGALAAERERDEHRGGFSRLPRRGGGGPGGGGGGGGGGGAGPGGGGRGG